MAGEVKHAQKALPHADAHNPALQFSPLPSPLPVPICGNARYRTQQGRRRQIDRWHGYAAIQYKSTGRLHWQPLAHVSQQTCIKLTRECIQIAVTYFRGQCTIKSCLSCPSPARVVWTSHICKPTPPSCGNARMLLLTCRQRSGAVRPHSTRRQEPQRS